MDRLILSQISSILLVLIILTAVFIITIKDLLTLISLYSLQSFLIVLLYAAAYLSEKTPLLIIIAVITLLSKVLLVPYIMRGVQKELRIKRDVEFHYLTPIMAIFASSIAFFLTYTTFSKFGSFFQNTPFRVTVSLSVSLVFMGLIIIFTRKQTITNIIGYLTMENGVLLFSIFVTELPLVIEILLLLDLIMIIILVTILAFGIDSDMEEFHKKLNPFIGFFGDKK